MATATSVSPSDVLPLRLDKVSIRSTAFPAVYLRSDAERPSPQGVNTLLNLQVTRQGWERHELILQDRVYGDHVYIIRSVKWNTFVHLDPIVLPEQQPKEGTTFHPRGVGRSSTVPTIEEASKFQIVVNESDGELEDIPFTLSFKLVGAKIGNRNVYLRLNGTDSSEFKGPGSGEVNGQTYIGPFEKLLVEEFR